MGPVPTAFGVRLEVGASFLSVVNERLSRSFLFSGKREF